MLTTAEIAALEREWTAIHRELERRGYVAASPPCRDDAACRAMDALLDRLDEIEYRLGLDDLEAHRQHRENAGTG